MKTFIFIVGLLLIITGCASSYPLGMSEEEWQALSPERQLQIREQQAALDMRKAEERRAAAAARQAVAEAEALALRSALQNAAYGQRIQCVFEGHAYFGRDWQPIEPVAFDAVVGHTIDVPLVSVSAYRNRQGYARFDGQRAQLCRRDPALYGSNNRCATLAGTQRQLGRGVTRDIFADDFVRGRMSCDLPPRGTW
ncbi:MAG: hypothetical protein Q8S08_09880 [Halomonas sp.]|nr:hypothetical protein [Halomonas sp.]MDP3535684.1 hypothetical protein [Halomonas sp.]